MNKAAIQLACERIHKDESVRLSLQNAFYVLKEAFDLGISLEELIETIHDAPAKLEPGQPDFAFVYQELLKECSKEYIDSVEATTLLSFQEYAVMCYWMDQDNSIHLKDCNTQMYIRQTLSDREFYHARDVLAEALDTWLSLIHEDTHRSSDFNIEVTICGNKPQLEFHEDDLGDDVLAVVDFSYKPSEE